MSKIAPSILSADFSKLGAEVTEICSYGIDFLHIDVMDGEFVPNISFGAGVMKSLNAVAAVPYDVHLMISEPVRYIKDFVTENTEYITIHYEACKDVQGTLGEIKKSGVRAGISIKPGTPVRKLENLLKSVDMVLVMSVEPGFGGQSFMPEALDKIKELVEIRERNGYDFSIEVDGGINEATSRLVREAGADILVAGSAVFKADDRKRAIEVIRG